MADGIRLGRILEIIRYCQAGALNAAFGYGLYAALVWVGVNLYFAQLLAHIFGVAFNYFTYSRHVFRDSGPAKGRFMLSYVVNYAMSAACLAALSLVVASPYLAGLGAIVIVSAMNYFLLRHMVFVPKSGA